MTQRVRTTVPAYPWLVAEENQRILGYAYACSHRQRAAYRWTVESSVYLRPECQGRGLGKALYVRLLDILERQGFRTILAGITLPNPASVRLHESLGYAPVGSYPGVGFKAGEWHKVQWLTLHLGDPQQLPGETRLLCEMGEHEGPQFAIDTPRLCLRPMGPGDEGELEMFVERERERLRAAFPLLVSQVVDADSARQFVRRKCVEWFARDSFSFAIRDYRQQFLGTLAFKHFEWSVPKGDLGYCLAQSAQGKGLISEAVKAVLPFAFEHLGLARLYLRIHPGNLGSLRVAEKCGFGYEGLVRCDFRGGDGQLQDVRYYAMTGEDWRATGPSSCR